MIIKNAEELEKLRTSGSILAAVLNLVASKVRPGVSAYDLDQLAEAEIRKAGGIPSFKHHRMEGGPEFPASLCVSVNDEVVHGIPTKEKILKEGDIVGLDLGVNYQGYFTDSAITVGVGKIEPQSAKLIEATRASLECAIAEIAPGKFTGDLGFATESSVKKSGFQVVRELVGHGVGKAVWEEPEIPCFGKKGSGTKLMEGMVIAVEPMVNVGGWQIIFAPDQWTIKTADHTRSAHFEHTLLVTKTGYEILTKA